MEDTVVLKALADETRLAIVRLLLHRNYCLRALSQELGLTPGGVSQHVRVLREAGLLEAQRRGYFMHFEVNRGALRALAGSIMQLADIEREEPPAAELDACHKAGKCGDAVKAACRGGHCGSTGRCGRKGV